jgi:psp operon transcriptional activator
MLLAEHFAISMAKELEREYFPGFGESARAALCSYDWPGNVRELKNVVERCVYRHAGDEPVERIVFDPFTSPYRPGDGSDVAEQAQTPAAAHTFPLDLKLTTQNLEIELIQQAMLEAKHNQRKAAELLQLTYHQLRGYLKKYELLKSDTQDRPSD